MKAYCLIRQQPWYRREAFVRGLEADGNIVNAGRPARVDAQTLVLMWNRYGELHDLACRVEKAGGTVLVAENGYLGRGGSVPKWDVHPRGPRPDGYYALAIGGHNGSGTWKSGGPERWERLGIELKPWRTEGGHVLICPSRSFGRPDTTMPATWVERIAAELRKYTKREIRIRKHPGNNAPERPLAEDLKDAWAVVIWASSAGVHALIAGIPVVCMAPWWICKNAAIDDIHQVDAFDLSQPWERMGADGTRLEAMQRLAWAQWTIEEIAGGEPFRYLLSDTRQAEGAAAV
jgi:hypothetical protein